MGEFPQLLGDLWPILLDDGDIYVLASLLLAVRSRPPSPSPNVIGSFLLSCFEKGPDAVYTSLSKVQ